MSLASITNNIFRLCPGLQPDLVRSFVQDSYAQLARMDWQCLNITRNIITTGPYATGTVDVNTSGSITGHGTTFTAAMVGGWMTLDWSDSKFQILTQTSPTSITIGGWSQVTLTGSEYTISFYIYKLPTPQLKVYDVTYQTSLPKKSQAYFNSIDPSRLETGQPLYWADAGFDIDGGTMLSQIEIYPIPDQQYPLRIYGKIYVDAVLPTVSTPSQLYLPEDLIESHALRQCFRVKDSLDPKGGWMERYKIEDVHYKELLADAIFEDFSRANAPDAVKDTQGTSLTYPASDTFAASHDVD